MNDRTNKIVSILSSLMEEYKKESILSLCVSDGNSKIGRIKNVSVAPLVTCKGICGTCSAHCYDGKAVLQYTDVARARARNTVILRDDPMSFFVQALRAAKMQKKGLFRWNVGGEIDSLQHLQIIVRIAQLVPNTKFLLFSKRHFLINSYCESMGGKDAIPSNLKLVFSFWPGMDLDNPYEFPVSCPYPDALPSGWKKRIGNCETCAEWGVGCWYAEKGDTIGFKYHGTRDKEFLEQWEKAMMGGVSA